MEVLNKEVNEVSKDQSGSVVVHQKHSAIERMKAIKTIKAIKAIKPVGVGVGIGKGGKGKMRHKNFTKERKITDAAIRRLARRGGVKRISSPIYDLTRDVLKEFLQKIISDTIVYTTYAKRKTVTSLDVISALKRNGKKLYIGFDPK